MLVVQLNEVRILQEFVGRLTSNDPMLTQFSGGCDDTCAISLAAALKWNTTLQSLDLGSESGFVVVECLVRNVGCFCLCEGWRDFTW